MSVMSEADISVVLCTFNGEKFLTAQMDSLRAQTLPPREVVIQDDASTDGTAALVAAYIEGHALTNWRFSVNAQNLGYRRNFRDAALKARGDWMAFCDQDDVWRADKLARLWRVAQAHPQAGAVAGSFDLIDAAGRPVSAPDMPGQASHGMIHRPLRPGEEYVFSACRRDTAMLLSGNAALGCALMASRPVVERWARFTSFALPHDWEIVLYAFETGGFCFLNEPVLDYRLHGGNAIGLPGVAASGGRGPSLSGRMARLDEFDVARAYMAALRQALGHAPLDEAYARFAALRRGALEERSLLKWLRLQRYHGLYANMLTLRQRLGDLYLIVKGEPTRR